MKFLPATSHRRMPWKNGGGETVEIAVSPDGAGLDDFDWRVSMARVDRNGPFSSFPDIDRTLSLLQGEGIVMNLDGRIPLGLTRLHEPVSFPADLPTSASLIGGPITDLNVMSRRGRVEHTVRFLDVHGNEPIQTEGEPSLILAIVGTPSYAAGFETGRLAPQDCLVIDAPTSMSLSSHNRTTIAVIEFRHI